MEVDVKLEIVQIIFFETMIKYNIFKIEKSRIKDLLKKLKKVGLHHTKTIVNDGIELSFYTSRSPEDNDIPYYKYYDPFLTKKDKENKNKSNSSVFMISSEEFLYAVSYGKSHSYLREFCDSDFGINFAARVQSSNLKIKNSFHFGGKKNRSITTYVNNSDLDFESGESIHLLKCKPVNTVSWGKSIKCGQSIQISTKLTPLELPKLIKEIENTLSQNPMNNIPRHQKITSIEEISKLDKKLCTAISTLNTKLSINEYEVSGVDYIFSDQQSFKFYINKKSSNIINDPSIEDLKNFLEINNIEIEKNLNKIKVQIVNDFGNKYVKNLKEILEFSDEEYVLINGKWFKFNKDFIDRLKLHVDKITVEHSDVDFNDEELLEFNKSKSKNKYPEEYFNYKRGLEGYINSDRILDKINGMKVEKFDLWKDNIAYVVKIGDPKKLSVAIDQCMLSIKSIRNKVLNIPSSMPITHWCLWLILDRKKRINRISDINSLNLLIKLNDWNLYCKDSFFTPVIRISYRK